MSPRAADAIRRLERLPRTPLAHLPTPLVPAPNLRADLGAGTPPLLLKLDSETGFALGGNKVRKLEHELAPPRLEGVTHLVTAGGVQSNHARVTAAAAARLGLRSILVLSGQPSEPPRGNALLHRLLGAEVVGVGDGAEREPAMQEAAARVEREGGRALVVPIGASTPLGALGYARAALELDDQLDGATAGGEEGPSVRIFVSTSSCGTLAGLLAGLALLGRQNVTLVGVSADVPRNELLEETLRIARGALDLLDAPPPPFPLETLVDATDEEVGDGYGIPTPASREALERMARTEGVVLDPVYTAKAAAGMLRWVRDGRLASAEAVVFLHTGGHPALFA
ncbi:MAG TPA: pyridoxal-phosphate dependent enzyme [Candidatus Thermoplasmatota archaeon]